jgi:N-succinyldiaminopimelate aminotransferase
MLNQRIGGMAPSAFMRLDAMMADLTPAPGVTPVNLTLGDPQIPPPRFILDAFEENHALFGRYTATDGTPEYRQAVLDLMVRIYDLPEGMIERDRNILPVAGLREGMAMLPQVVTPDEKAGLPPVILIPNPFYHPYAGAAVAAHGEPVFVPALAENRFMPDFVGLDEATLSRTAAAFVCTPANPQGTAASLDYLCAAIELARAHDFLLIVDECYAEVYVDQRPPGALEACARLGGSLDNVVTFHSLSKRSSAPGLRSGFAVGDGEVLRRYFKLRNYVGVAVSRPILAAATALLRDTEHVAEIRAYYKANFDAAHRILGNRYGYYRPDGGFFLWLDVGDGVAAAKRLWTEAAIKVVPGELMSRDVPGSDAVGKPYIRVALVHDLASTIDSLERLTEVLG